MKKKKVILNFVHKAPKEFIAKVEEDVIEEENVQANIMVPLHEENKDVVTFVKVNTTTITSEENEIYGEVVCSENKQQVDFSKFFITNLYVNLEADKVKLKREMRYNLFDNLMYFL